MNKTMPQSPQQWHAAALAGGFRPDAAQLAAVAALQRSFEQLQQGQTAGASLYLWGPPGRGKTWLMDRFYANLPCSGRRQHFHHFMRDLHRALLRLTGTANPLQHWARELAQEVRVLCFDEFFISDIADAMLLGPLFQQLFDEGLAVVMTSNQAPQQLYADGFNRSRFLPAIAAIETAMQVLEVNGGRDHRRPPGADLPGFHLAGNASGRTLAAVFRQLTGQPPQPAVVELGGRALAVQGCTGTVLWCDFQSLCGQPRSASDYIELVQRFKVLLLGQVPALGGQRQAVRIARGTEDAVRQVTAGDRILPALAPADDSVRRFIALIDELYEGKVRLHMEASVPLQHLYTEGYLAFPFRRTLSRLGDMLGQSTGLAWQDGFTG